MTKKKILSRLHFAMVLGSLLTLSLFSLSCQAVQEITQAMSNMAQLKFRLNGVREFQLAGVRLAGKSSLRLADSPALLSAVAEVPLRQGVAATGSVDQLGRVQAVGGVTEKVEGFFEVCRDRGLTGDQGVLVPVANVPHLVLRDEVRAAMAEGRFHVWPVARIDEGLEILSGLPAGERDAAGAFPPATFNGRVAARLAAFAEQARAFGRSGGREDGRGG